MCVRGCIHTERSAPCMAKFVVIEFVGLFLQNAEHTSRREALLLQHNFFHSRKVSAYFIASHSYLGAAAHTTCLNISHADGNRRKSASRLFIRIADHSVDIRSLVYNMNSLLPISQT